MRINVKPLTHWIIYKGYTVRFTKRTPSEVTGILRTPADTEIPFAYDPRSLVVRLPKTRIIINEHGWELEKVDAPDYNSSEGSSEGNDGLSSTES